MIYAAIDLEFNQSFDFGNGNYTLPDKNCPFEIIQIGVVLLDQNGQILDSKDFMVRPSIYPQMHPYVEKLTGLNMQKLDQAPKFPEAYDAFIQYLGTTDLVLLTWGNNDVKVLYKNIQYYHLNNKSLTRKYINVQNLASIYLKKPQSMSIGLKNAVSAFELESDIPFHNALNDALYTAKIFQIVKNDSMPVQVFHLSQLKTQKEPKKQKLDTVALYQKIEKDIGRKLAPREKNLARKIYDYGKKRLFDLEP